jgi:molybdopterin synthase catalytic subunit
MNMPSANDNDWLDLLSTPLNVAQAIEFITTPAAGGMNIFLGTTRAETNPDGRQLLALDYQAYESMAHRQLVNLAQKSRQQWPIIKLAILHRIGQVPLAKPSVVIAVSTPHRAQSFEACRWLIDELKKEVTIWKREVWADGSTSWVTPSTEPKAPLPG